jgi:hypothetical protein
MQPHRNWPGLAIMDVKDVKTLSQSVFKSQIGLIFIHKDCTSFCLSSVPAVQLSTLGNLVYTSKSRGRHVSFESSLSYGMLEVQHDSKTYFAKISIRCSFGENLSNVGAVFYLHFFHSNFVT